MRDQSFVTSIDNLSMGGYDSFADRPLYMQPTDRVLCSYELDGSFTCEPWTRHYDFVGFHAELNQWLPPEAPPIPDPDASMDYSLTASGRFGPRNAVAGTAVAWDFGMSWAADLSLELAISCTGPDCDPESSLVSGGVPGLAQIDAFPCATTVEYEGANLDGPNIPD